LPEFLPDKRKIYLSGIPQNSTVDDIRVIFQSFIGEVEDVKIIDENTLGLFRYGFVTLKRLEDIELCLNLEQITIGGHNVSLKKFKRKKKRAMKKREKLVLEDDSDLLGSVKSKKGSSHLSRYSGQNPGSHSGSYGNSLGS
jgi:RNA recognition motif. (a.k.a. RRM, RBD, or RNP domain)